MAILIPISKDFEDHDVVVYAYTRQVWAPDPDRNGRDKHVGDQIGKIGLDKETGEMVRLTDIPDEYLDFYLPRVMRKMREAYQAKRYPVRIDYMA